MKFIRRGIYGNCDKCGQYRYLIRAIGGCYYLCESCEDEYDVKQIVPMESFDPAKKEGPMFVQMTFRVEPIVRENIVKQAVQKYYEMNRDEMFKDDINGKSVKIPNTAGKALEAFCVEFLGTYGFPEHRVAEGKRPTLNF